MIGVKSLRLPIPILSISDPLTTIAGSPVAMRSSRSIVIILQSQGSFIEHIGSDDFVFIMDVSLVEDASKEIIDAFDHIVPTLYEAEDKERGYIETRDRQRNIRQFPFVALSIGITNNKQRSFTHYGRSQKSPPK